MLGDQEYLTKFKDGTSIRLQIKCFFVETSIPEVVMCLSTPVSVIVWFELLNLGRVGVSPRVRKSCGEEFHTDH